MNNQYGDPSYDSASQYSTDSQLGYSSGGGGNGYHGDGYDFSEDDYSECYSLNDQSVNEWYLDEDELSSEVCTLYERSSLYTDSQSDLISTTWSQSSEQGGYSSSAGTNHGSRTSLQNGVVTGGGILKRREGDTQYHQNAIKGIQNIEKSNNGTIVMGAATNGERTLITSETIEKVRETELEDILQHAKDITDPDPSAGTTFCTQPAKLVEGSFKHLLAVKEVYSKTGAFKHRTIEMHRTNDEPLGFSMRKGDGWERREGIFISRLALGSVFDVYGLLNVGDELIKINKVDVKKMSLDDVVRLMYIPERLTVTVKMLTPFSKKRVAKAGINPSKKGKKFVASGGGRTIDYKIANLKIGGGKRNVATPKQVELKPTDSNSTTVNQQQASKSKISPYRTTPSGTGVQPTNRILSPIREVSSETQLAKPSPKQEKDKKRRHSNVTWSDQRSAVSEPS